MLIQQVSRDEPETIDLMVLNVSGATATAGMGMRFLGGAVGEIASADGINATRMTSAPDFKNFAGVVLEDIPSNRHGQVRAYGKVNSIFYSAEADKTIGVGAVQYLQPGAIAGSWTSTFDYLVSTRVGNTMMKSLQSWETTNISGGVPIGAGFARGL